MTIQEAMKERHSVRSYLDKEIEEEKLDKLRAEIDHCNRKGGMNIQLITNEEKAFSGMMAHFGKFSGVKNYIAMIGDKDASLDEKCGYYGERLVLLAQQLGLNTCWVYMTYSKQKKAYKINPGEKLCIVIALGYGATQGTPHISKTIEQISKTDGDMPDWFKSGVEAALLAPTAMNQQKFMFELHYGKVLAVADRGICTKIDLGIVKYHFAQGAGRQNFEWAK
ncbi:MAG: nitroreductase [Ruminococcus sp.]|nr:nitroreductase [Ruminococcus sp.]